MYGLTLIVVLSFVGGLIAYLGDKIGMKIGRKKLSLFGLRPKHTSILITIFTGIFIAVSSITVLTIVSNDVRTALFRMRAIQEALVTSESQLRDSTVQVQAMEENLRSLTEERDEAAEALLGALDLLEETQLEVDEGRVRVEELEQRGAALEQRYSYLLDGYESLVSQYDRLVEEYLRLETKMRTGDLALRAGEVFHVQVFNSGGTLTEVSESLTTFLAEADRRALVRGARVESDQNLAIMLAQQTFDMAVYSIFRQQEPAVVRAVSRDNTVVGEPVVTFLEIIPRELVFRPGDVLAEIEIDALQVPEVDRAIVDMIGEANERAIAAGMYAEDGAAVVVRGEQFLQAIAAIKESDGPVRIEATAAQDSWTTEGPIQLDLTIHFL